MGSYTEKMRDVQNLSNKNLRKREKMMVEIYQKSAKEISQNWRTRISRFKTLLRDFILLENEDSKKILEIKKYKWSEVTSNPPS